jgi:cytochrome c oxidase assembly protein subunit 15
LLPTPISVTHAVLAQSLFLLLVFIAYTHSREWQRRAGERQATAVRATVATLPAVVFLQLLLGALMRHTEAGLAIPDFPLMGGRLVPRFDEQMLATINATRFQLLLEPVVTGQVVTHFLHRLGAAATLAAVVAANLDLRRRPAYHAVRRLLPWINVLVLVQVTLGALTVLTVRLPLVASLHVFVGAALLAVTLLCLLRCVPVPAGAARAAGGGSGTVAQERPARAGPVRRAIAHHS